MLISCTICSDLFTGSDTESIWCTPCGHAFHYECLMNWFERVQSCPQCRQKASEKNIVRLYFSLGTSGGENEETPDYLKNKVDNLAYQIRLKDLDIKDLKEKNEEFKTKNRSLLAHVKTVEDKVRRNETVNSSLQDQVKLLKNECKELSLKRSEAEYYREKHESLKHVEKLLQGTVEEGEEILKNNKLNYDHLVRSLKLFKRETEEMRRKIKSLKADRASREKKITELESKLSAVTRDFRNTSAAKTRLEEDLDHAEKEVVKWKNNCLDLQKTNESLMNYSKTKSNLMKRRILEEPAPDSLAGHNLDTDSPLNVTVYDISTPSPVQVPKVRSFMSKKYDEVPLLSSSQKSTSSSASSSSTSSSLASSSSASSSKLLSDSSSNRGVIRKNRFTSDPWENIGIIQKCTARPDEIYDGLGGHSKIDVFPQPRPNALIKKKKVANFKVHAKKKKMDDGPDLPKISSFLKTYDDDLDLY